MRSARNLTIWLSASALAFASAACSGGNNNGDSSMQGDGGVRMDGSSDGGSLSVVTGTWTAATSGTIEDIHSVWGSSATDIYAVASQSILHYASGTWSSTASMYVLTGLSGSGPNDIWTVGITVPASGSGEAGVVVMQHNTTGMFVDSMPALMADLSSLSFTSATNGWVAGGMGRAAHWDGSNWTSATNGLDGTYIAAVYAIGPTDAVAVGEKVWRWNGTSWAMEPTVNTSMAHTFGAVWASSASNVWVVGQYGFIQHWDGTTWTDSDPGNNSAGSILTTDLYAVWGTAPNDVWAAGDQGTIIHWNGASWSLIAGGGGSSPTTQGIHSIWGTSANDIWAGGDHGTLLHYR